MPSRKASIAAIVFASVALPVGVAKLGHAFYVSASPSNGHAAAWAIQIHACHSRGVSDIGACEYEAQKDYQAANTHALVQDILHWPIS